MTASWSIGCPSDPLALPLLSAKESVLMSRKPIVRLCLSLGLILLAAGLNLIFCAAPLGMEAAGSALRANGGTMDSERYRFILESARSAVSLGVRSAR